MHNLCVCVCVCVCVYVFISLGYIPQSSINRLYGNSVFNIFRTCQTVSQSGHTII